MKRIVFICLAAALLSAQSAYAKCTNGSKTVFSCITTKAKVIEVCKTKSTIAYSFGKPHAKPEIEVKILRQQASTFQWAGIGRYMSYAVDIPNGNTTYSVFWGVDRITPEHAIEAGVNVLINNNLKATVPCSGKNIEQHLEGIDLKPTE